MIQRSAVMKFALLPLCFLTAVAAGQSSVPSESLLQAIVGARIEIGDGRVIPVGTIVMREGLIWALGQGISVPAGAEILDGKGLTVYPGFIDAYTTKGIKLPDAQADADDVPDFSSYAPAMMREANRKGITPEIHASQHLALSEDIRKAYWNAGFTSAMVVPGAGNLSGFGSLVNLGGRAARNSVVVRDTGLECGLNRGTGGVPGPGQPIYYPGTALGYIAQTRQTFLDAEWYARVNRAFQEGGSVRPPVDASLDALQPILGGSMPVFFDADSRRWMERSLTIADEFHLKPVIAGAKEAWKMTDLIKSRAIPLIVSVSFGKEPDPEKSLPKLPAKPGEAGPVDATGPDNSTKKTEDDPEPKEQVGERQRLFREQLGNMIALAKAGISFSLTTKGTKDMGEFMANLRRAVKEGLSRDVVLQALTLEPSRLFGVQRQLGTIESGKIANLVVMSGDFLDEHSKTKMIYVDGRKIDPTRGAPASAPRSFGGQDN